MPGRFLGWLDFRRDREHTVTRRGDLSDPTHNAWITGHRTASEPAGKDQHAGFGFTTMEPPNTTVADRIYYCKDTNFRGSPCIHVYDDINKCMFARSYHPDGVNTAMADGSVHFIAEDIRIDVYAALITRAGREVVDFSELY